MIILRQAWDHRRAARATSVARMLVLMLLIACFSNLTAAAAPPNANPTGKNQATSIDPNSNNMTAWKTRENYFKRFPFAKNAYDHDKKSPYHEGEVVNNGNGSFLDGLFGDSGDGSNDFTDLFGGSTPGGSTSGDERLQQSDAPAAGSPVTAYPFFIKFCDDDPYQGVCYWQFGEAIDTPAAERDMELFENVLTTFGYPVSDTQFQIIQRENFQRLLELLFDPERNTWMLTNTAQQAGASASNSLAGAAESSWNTCIDYVMNGADGSGAMINVANERAATPISDPNILYKSVSEAVYMVQRMYKEVFVPMAILFLLPGAVVTQVKSTVRSGFNIEQSPNPFEGILRSIVAVFLIPATQVIVSYSIDVGNSMADSVKEWVDVDLVLEWSHELTYNVTPENHKNVISPPAAQQGGPAPASAGIGSAGSGSGGGGGGGGGGGSSSGLGSIISGIGSAISGAIGGLFGAVGAWFGQLFGPIMAPFIAAFNGLFGSGGDGIAANIPEQYTKQEDQLALSQVFQTMVNGTVFFVSLSIIMLTAFQIVFMCYLFLLGPLSAALFAWPMVSSTGYFRAVFGKWVEAVICLALWRFYWTVALAIMTQRLVYIGSGKFGTGDLQWEAIIFCCALGLMLWAAMNPFIYDPAKAGAGVEQTVQTGNQLGGGGQGGGGGGAGGGGGQSGGASGPGGGGDQSGGAQPQPGGQQAPQQPPATAGAINSTQSGGGGSLTSSVNVASGGSGGGAAGPDGDDGSPGSSGAGSSGSSGSDGSSSTSPNAPPPPSASADGGAGGGGGGADDGGGGDTVAGAAGAAAMSMPPSADGGGGGGGDSGGGGDDSACRDAAGGAGMPDAQPMGQGTAPVPLGPSDSGCARYNSGAGAASISAAASGSGGGGGGASGGGGGPVNIALNLSGPSDSGGSTPTPEAPPVPPPPSSDMA